MTLTDAGARALIARAHTDRAFRERVIAHCRQPAMPPSPKETHASVHYRPGTPTRKCALCTMFRPLASCTAVQLPIHPDDLCDLFVRNHKLTVGQQNRTNNRTEDTT